VKKQFDFHDHYNDAAKEINDAFEFASRIHKLAEKIPSGGTGALWFRGQADGCWPLVPSIGRKNPLWLGYRLREEPKYGKGLRRMKEVEYDFIDRFRRHAHAFLRREPTLWESITMAQHYGLPTRLMDWTSNPLVALYFAVESQEDEDGAVFAFRPSEVVERRINMYSDDSRSHKHERYPLGVKGIRIIYPMMSSDRLVAQSGGFTIQEPWTPLEDQSQQSFDEKSLEIFEIYKWRLPQGKKRSVASQLLRAGISHKSLFPGLEGIGKGLLRAELLRK
jgi:hypothetical protein